MFSRPNYVPPRSSRTAGIVLFGLIFMGLCAVVVGIARRSSPATNDTVVRPTTGPIAALRLPAGFAVTKSRYRAIVEAADGRGRNLSIHIIEPGSGADLLLRQGDSANLPWTTVALNGQTFKYEMVNNGFTGFVVEARLILSGSGGWSEAAVKGLVSEMTFKPGTPSAK